jgi:integrase
MDGRQRRKTLQARNLTDARKEARSLRVQLDRGEIVAPSTRRFGELLDEWLEHYEGLVAAGRKSERTLERYRGDVEVHVRPFFGTRKAQAITTQDVSRFLRTKREDGLAENTQINIIKPLSLTFKFAVLRGYVASSPFERLDRDELPHARNATEPRVLDRDELSKLIANTPEKYRPVIATLALTGLRLQEALGLTWETIDFESGVLRLRSQLSRATGKKPARLIPLKTARAKRDIRLETGLATLLKKHKASAFAKGRARPDDFVFQSETGSAMYYRNVANRGLTVAAEAVGLNADDEPKLTCHDLRHSYGSHLLAQGVDVVRVSRQMGHSRPSVTLDCYAHVIEKVQHSDVIDAGLRSAFGGVLST